MTFVDLTSLDDRLAALLAEARRLRHAGRPAVEVWPGIRARLLELAGPGRQPEDTVLSSRRAYETARAALAHEFAGRWYTPVEAAAA